MKPFRLHHTLHILESFESSTLPLDAFLSSYFRKNKSVGSKDRKEICETIYGITRWKALLDYHCKGPITWDERISLYSTLRPSEYAQDATIPLHIRMSCPKHLFDFLQNSIGEKKAIDFCLASNTKAPVTLRVNPLKTTRDSLFTAWKNRFQKETIINRDGRNNMRIITYRHH